MLFILWKGEIYEVWDIVWVDDTVQATGVEHNEYFCSV
jgi:hypothetical protein